MQKRSIRFDDAQIEFFEKGEHPFPGDLSKFMRTAANVYIRSLKDKTNPKKDASTT